MSVDCSRDVLRLRQLFAVGIHALPHTLYKLIDSDTSHSLRLYCSLWLSDDAEYPYLISTPSPINDSPYFELTPVNEHVMSNLLFPPPLVATCKKFILKFHLVSGDPLNSEALISTDSPALQSVFAELAHLDEPTPASLIPPEAEPKPKVTSTSAVALPGCVLATLSVAIDSLHHVTTAHYPTLVAGPLHSRLLLFFQSGVFTTTPCPEDADEGPPCPPSPLTSTASAPASPHVHTHIDMPIPDTVPEEFALLQSTASPRARLALSSVRALASPVLPVFMPPRTANGPAPLGLPAPRDADEDSPAPSPRSPRSASDLSACPAAADTLSEEPALLLEGSGARAATTALSLGSASTLSSDSTAPTASTPTPSLSSSVRPSSAEQVPSLLTRASAPHTPASAPAAGEGLASALSEASALPALPPPVVVAAATETLAAAEGEASDVTDASVEPAAESAPEGMSGEALPLSAPIMYPSPLLARVDRHSAAARPDAPPVLATVAGVLRQASEAALHKSILSDHYAVARINTARADRLCAEAWLELERRVPHADTQAMQTRAWTAADIVAARTASGEPLLRLAGECGVGGLALMAQAEAAAAAQLEMLVCAEEAALAAEEEALASAETALADAFADAVGQGHTAKQHHRTQQSHAALRFAHESDVLGAAELQARHRERVLLDELVRVLPVTCAPAEDCKRELIEGVLATQKASKHAQLRVALAQRLDAHFAACGDRVWRIRGTPLLLSRVMAQMGTPDMLEQTAAGLGYAVQLVMLFAKYTRTPLTYPLAYMGARSCVYADERSTPFPLHLRPGQEKRFLEAVNYLNLNVMHLIASRLPPHVAARARPQGHNLLENLHLLLMHEVPAD